MDCLASCSNKMKSDEHHFRCKFRQSPQWSYKAVHFQWGAIECLSIAVEMAIAGCPSRRKHSAFSIICDSASPSQTSSFALRWIRQDGWVSKRQKWAATELEQET